MATTHSYGATLKNNKTENEAVIFVLSQNPCLLRPTREERKEILKQLNLPATFSRAFDLVLVPTEASTIASTAPTKLKLIELKTTKKRLRTMPTGFFFGATENEFQLAKKMGDKYLFCFVSLHAESRQYILMSAEDLESKIKTRRVQYQINL